MEHSVLIVGIGNVLLSDEGLGIHAIERLKTLDLPEYVTLLQCGTDLMSLENQYGGYSRILLIDAMYMGDEPGTLHVLREQDVASFASRSASAHGLSAIELSLLLKGIYRRFARAEFVFLGIEPENLAPGHKLSPAIEAAMPALLEEIRNLVQI